MGVNPVSPFSILIAQQSWWASRSALLVAGQAPEQTTEDPGSSGTGASAALPTPPPQPPAPAPVEDGTSSTEVDVRLRSRITRTDAQLQIVTDEGDTVTLSLHAETEATRGRIVVATEGEDGTHGAVLKFREYSVSANVTMAVEGDLNEQELADIEKLVANLQGLLGPGEGRGHHHEREHGDRAVQATSDLLASGDYASLDGFTMSVTREVSMTRIHLRAQSTEAWQMLLGGASPKGVAVPVPAREVSTTPDGLAA